MYFFIYRNQFSSESTELQMWLECTLYNLLLNLLVANNSPLVPSLYTLEKSLNHLKVYKSKHMFESRGKSTFILYWAHLDLCLDYLCHGCPNRDSRVTGNSLPLLVWLFGPLKNGSNYSIYWEISSDKIKCLLIITNSG